LAAVRRLDSAPCEHYHGNMAATLDVLTQEALVLPPDQRIALAHRLLSSVELDPDPDAEAAWEQEIARRIAQSDAGEITPVPAAEVFARLQRIAPDRP
jgi:putative addiction module component (TIGR02574 family)